MPPLIQQVLKLGLDKTNEIHSLFLSLSPSPTEINATDEHGDTLVHFAARSQSLALLQLLSEYHANMEAVNEHGRQPLHEAIDDLSCVQYLLDVSKVDINAMKRGDWTPLMIASLKGEFSIVRCLVDHGALLDLTSKDGRTALHMAVQEGHAEVAEYLASCCPSSMYVETKSGRIPIQMAAALTSERQMAGDRMTRYFISLSGTSRMLAHMDRSGRTVLEDAVVANQIELVKWLIQEHGATPERLDALGRNGWHHAAMMGHVTMIQQLQALTTTNTSLDQADTWDLWTPLMYAAKNGHLDCVRCLLELRADKTKKDKLGRTAKDLASLWHHEDIVKEL